MISNQRWAILFLPSAWPRMFVVVRGNQEILFSLLSRHASNVSRITRARALAVARVLRPHHESQSGVR